MSLKVRVRYGKVYGKIIALSRGSCGGVWDGHLKDGGSPDRSPLACASKPQGAFGRAAISRPAEPAHETSKLWLQFTFSLAGSRVLAVG